MKVIAKTTGPFMLMDTQTNDLLVDYEPRVVTWTQFKEARSGKGQIKSLASNLPNEANDADFQEYLAEAGDEDLAVASYVSALSPEPEPKPKPKPKRATKQTPAETGE